MSTIMVRPGRKRLVSKRFADGFNVPVSKACLEVNVTAPTLKAWLQAGKCPYGNRKLEFTIRDEEGYRRTWWMRQADVTYLKRVVEKKLGA